MSAAREQGPGENPFAAPDAAAGYEEWYAGRGRRADRLEKRLLQKLLALFPGNRTILDVGCGTGHFTRWFAGRGFEAAGIDPSRFMLEEARRSGGALYVRGDGEALPFPDAAFDLTALITALEFIPDPARALREAVRVSRSGVILGALNGRSLLGRRLSRKGGTIWPKARLFTPAELLDLSARAAAARGKGAWWRTSLWPLWPGALPLPFGGFIGVAVTLTARP